MKKIVIIDDEPLARSIVMEYLQNLANVEVVAECNNGYEGVKAIMIHKPDLIFLDIQMPKINGFEMLELIDTIPSVIFATAFDEYAIKAFEANAVDYLLKPFSKERFDVAINKWLSKTEDDKSSEKNIYNLLENTTKQNDEKNRIVVKTNSEITIVPVSDVVYIEAYDDYVKIFTKDTYYLKKKTMNYYEQVLDPAKFFRAHRSYIFNLQHLTRIEPLEKNSHVVLLKSGKKIPLSRPSYSKLKSMLGI
ncbi:LytR/AlgR family response regulator transcription factor [Aurantibacillus circumpalustris]|uniref:LytR/AlgR family response regulator transcription factor n=1 Tax=Aurantibacillus circumpalustris TaxID=3036359 RepID=UPI00295C006C|nr:LytTR family transcriptional regulator DNA-binding domain-containing protein [Aurantibacillus circumpalustris]